VRIDGVGYQGHLVTETTPTQSTPCPSEADLTAALKVTADLGVDVAYTEIDIRMKTPANAQKLQALADAYGRVAKSCINVPRCVGMTIWVSWPLFLANVLMRWLTWISQQGISDKYSWVPNTFSGEGEALLWTSNYQKKTAYTSFLQGISSAPKTTKA